MLRHVDEPTGPPDEESRDEGVDDAETGSAVAKGGARPAPFASAPDSEKLADPPPGFFADAFKVVVPVDADGNGAAMLGLDVDSVASARSTDPGAKVTYAESHTTGITRVSVARAKTKNGTVLVAVTPK